MNTLATDVPAAPYPLSRRVVDTFVSPGRLFEYFREHTPWVGPLLITIVIGVATVLLVPAELIVQQAEEAFRESGQGAAAAPDLSTMGLMGKLFGAAAVVIGQPILAFLAAAILLLVFTTILSGEARYQQYLTITTHVLLITALGGLITLPLMILSGNLELQLSLSLLTPFLDPESILFRILRGLNIFTLWALVVSALGVSIINRRPSWGTASAILLGVYLVLVVGIAVITSLVTA